MRTLFRGSYIIAWSYLLSIIVKSKEHNYLTNASRGVFDLANSGDLIHFPDCGKYILLLENRQPTTLIFNYTLRNCVIATEEQKINIRNKKDGPITQAMFYTEWPEKPDQEYETIGLFAFVKVSPPVITLEFGRQEYTAVLQEHIKLYNIKVLDILFEIKYQNVISTSNEMSAPGSAPPVTPLLKGKNETPAPTNTNLTGAQNPVGSETSVLVTSSLETSTLANEFLIDGMLMLTTSVYYQLQNTFL